MNELQLNKYLSESDSDFDDHSSVDSTRVKWYKAAYKIKFRQSKQNGSADVSTNMGNSRITAKSNISKSKKIACMIQQRYRNNKADANISFDDDNDDEEEPDTVQYFRKTGVVESANNLTQAFATSR